MQIKDLNPHPRNPRKAEQKKLEMLAKSLIEFGSLDGFIFNSRTKRLISAHQRQKVLPKDARIIIDQRYDKPTPQGTLAVGYVEYLGERHPYRQVDWPEEKESAGLIAANKGAGEWDLPKLQEFVIELDSSNFDLDLTMFDKEELKDLFGKDFGGDKAKDAIEDDVPVVPKVPVSKLGDLYELGEHRLLCGDSTDKATVERLMNGVKADITFTSPPYNLGKFEVSGPKATNPGRKEKYLTVKDDMSPEKYEQFIFDVIAVYLPISTSVLLNIGLMEGNKRPVMNVIHRHLDSFKETLYWKKSTSTPHIQPGIVTSLVEPIFAFGTHNSRQFKSATFKGNCNNVIEGQNASGNEYAKIHAATFPVYLPEWIITNFSTGAVIDPFGGSGSTLIACEKTKRKCFMMELDPHYIDVIVSRWCKYTGCISIKRNGEPMEWNLN